MPADQRRSDVSRRKAISRSRDFPRASKRCSQYDVVIFGDVDPRQFSDRAAAAGSDFVGKKGGGFGMIAGPQWSPQRIATRRSRRSCRSTSARVQPDDRAAVDHAGLSPGADQGRREARRSSASSPTSSATKNSLKDEIQPIFWYCRGVAREAAASARSTPSIRSDIGPDGRKAPLLVLGHFGGGRTLFSRDRRFLALALSTPAKASSTPTGCSSSATSPAAKSSASGG